MKMIIREDFDIKLRQALDINFEDLIKSLIDKFEEDKRGVTNDN